MTPEARKFLELLHPGEGYRDARAISSDRKTIRKFGFATSNYEHLDEFYNSKITEGLNLFVGVATRSHPNGRRISDCQELAALFADIDFKAVSEEEARKRLAEFPIQPNIVVATGGGLHVYWLLDKPIDMQVNPVKTKNILRALANKIGADLGAATPERILRVPGTLNYKYDPPRHVVLERVTESPTTLDALLALLGPIEVEVEKKHEPVKHSLSDEDRIKLAKEFLKKQPPAISGSGGDQHTYNIACAIAIGHDLNAEQSLQALKEWNARCEPPWSKSDLESKIRNAIQYGDKSERGSKLVIQTRILKYTPASEIDIRPVHWVWQGRMAAGALCLLAGREGIGKSLLAYQLVADLTQGRLPGKFLGTSKNVVIVATEDSWGHTIVPRLMAAGADLRRVFRLDVETSGGVESTLSLPKDIKALEQIITDLDVAMVLLDPLMSRLDKKLDTHKDAEVRQALEPVSKIAQDTNVVVLGLIHVNKSSGTDPMRMVMASVAFVAVARSMTFVMADPEDDMVRLVNTPKNNLGRLDLPTLMFTVVEQFIKDTPEGKIHTGKLVWKGETDRRLTDEIETSQDDERGAIVEASEWLRDFLTLKKGFCESSEVRKEAKRNGISDSTLKRARKRMRVIVESRGFPRTTFWCLIGHVPPEDIETDAQGEF